MLGFVQIAEFSSIFYYYFIIVFIFRHVVLIRCFYSNYLFIILKFVLKVVCIISKSRYYEYMKFALSFPDYFYMWQLYHNALSFIEL